MNLQEIDSGFIIETAKVFVFFGKKNSQLEQLQKVFPDYHFSRIRQVHGTQIQFKNEMNSATLLEGDAQWSHLSMTGLCISTADCAPVFIYDSARQRIAAVHAGWRGLADRIIPMTCELFLKDNSRAEDLYVFIGPHIQMQSFEVDEDVKNKLLKSNNNVSNDCVEARGSNKFHVDLNQIIKIQLQTLEIQSDHLYSLHLDTKSDQRFHSYRRDKEKSGRQLSFILKK